MKVTYSIFTLSEDGLLKLPKNQLRGFWDYIFWDNTFPSMELALAEIEKLRNDGKIGVGAVFYIIPRVEVDE